MSTCTVHRNALDPRAVALASLGTLLLASCASTTVGKVSGGRYTAPDDLFSMPIPQLGLGLVVEDDFGTSPDGSLRAGHVSFHDDFGGIRSIAYEEFPEEARAEVNSQEAMRSYFNDGFVADLRMRAPGTQVIHQTPTVLGDGSRGLFSVLEIPEGSPMVVIDAEHPEGRRMDSTRAFLLVVRDDLFLTLSAADDFVFTGVAEEAAASTSEIGPLREELANLYASMRFD
jgi:hypothetical protein